MSGCPRTEVAGALYGCVGEYGKVTYFTGATILTVGVLMMNG